MINNKFCANADINNMGEGTRLECKRQALPELNIIIGTTYYLKIRKQHIISFILLMDLNSVNHCDPCGLYLLHIPIILVGRRYLHFVSENLHSKEIYESSILCR